MIMKAVNNHHHHLDQQRTKLDLLFLVRDGSTSEPIGRFCLSSKGALGYGLQDQLGHHRDTPEFR